MTKEELNLKELDEANGGLAKNAGYLVITYKDKPIDTETKEQRNYMDNIVNSTEILTILAKHWCSQNWKFFVSYRVEKDSK